MLTRLVSGDFLTRSRIRLWSIALLAATLLAIGFLAVTAHGLNDYRGRPLGTDFSDVYAAGELTRDGLAAAAYDWPTHYRQEQAIFGLDTPFYGWHYPPFFLFVAGPLSDLPYIPALVFWQVATLGAYLMAVRALLRSGPAPAMADDPLWLLAALGFSAVFVNLTHGQNGFLTAALLAGGLALLDKRPVAAGLLFGLMAYKPQFAILLPLALAAGGHWKTLAAATATAAGLVVLSTLSFGFDIWPAFVASTHLSRTVVLEEGNTGFAKIQSTFAAIRAVGGGLPLAYGMQAAVALAAAAAVTLLWRGPASPALKGAGLCLGIVLATPYSLDYDLMVLAPAIALIAGEGHVRGFRSGEGLVLSALWLVPLVGRPLANATHLVVAPVVVMTALVLVVLRIRRAF